MRLLSGRRGTDYVRSTGVERVVWWLLGLASAVIVFGITAFTMATRDTVKENMVQINQNRADIAAMKVDIKYIREGVDNLNHKLEKKH